MKSERLYNQNLSQNLKRSFYHFVWDTLMVLLNLNTLNLVGRIKIGELSNI